MEYKGYFLIPAIIRADTFILLLFQDLSSAHAQFRSKHPKLPSNEWFSIPCGSAIRNVEFQTRKIETYRLTDGFDVRLLESKKYAQSFENEFIRIVGNVVHFQLCQLIMKKGSEQNKKKKGEKKKREEGFKWT